MERPPTHREKLNGGVFVSCGECLKLNLPWKKKASSYSRSSGTIYDVTTTFYPPVKKAHHQQQRTRVGGFKYDPFSYAQNFDDSAADDVDQEFYSHGFSSRFAAPVSKSSSSTGANICMN